MAVPVTPNVDLPLESAVEVLKGPFPGGHTYRGLSRAEADALLAAVEEAKRAREESAPTFASMMAARAERYAPTPEAPLGPVKATRSAVEGVLADTMRAVLQNHISVDALQRPRELKPGDVHVNLHLWERLGTAFEAVRALKGFKGSPRGYEIAPDPESARQDRAERDQRLAAAVAAGPEAYSALVVPLSEAVRGIAGSANEPPAATVEAARTCFSLLCRGPIFDAGGRCESCPLKKHGLTTREGAALRAYDLALPLGHAGTDEQRPRCEEESS